MIQRSGRMRDLFRAGLLVPMMAVAMLMCAGLPAGVEAEVAGLGSTTSLITIDDALHGETYQRIVQIVNNAVARTVELELTCDPEFADGDFCDWVTFYSLDDLSAPVQSLMVPPGEYVPIRVVIAVPDDAPVGRTEGVLEFSTFVGQVAVESETGVESKASAGLTLELKTKVVIDVVGVPVISGVAGNFRAEDTEIGYPVRFTVDFENTGNVRVYPEVAVEILKDGEIVDSFRTDGQKVERGAKTPLVAEWDTKYASPGEYTANVIVYMEGESIGSGQVAFAVLREGTLTRAGAMMGLKLDEGILSVGKLAKLLVSFRNVGEIDTKARFEGEIYRDGDLIDFLQSGEILVPAGQEGVISAYYKVEQPGRYRISGYVNYEGQTTSTMSLSFEVQGVDTAENPAATATGIPDGGVPNGTPDTALAAPNAEDGDNGGSDFPLLWASIAVLAALAIAAGGLFWRNRLRAGSGGTQG